MPKSENQSSRDHRKPRVSIGLPVYNGENFLKEALDSILAQSYNDFELIISDNASTDGTSEICRAYATRDQRIRYYRNDGNLGAAKNFNRVLELAQGDYFKWATHDDVLAPDLIVKCVALLEQDPTIVLGCSKVDFIDAQGAFLGKGELNVKMDSPKANVRFHDLACLPHGCYQICGVIRTGALKEAGGMGNYTGADRVLLARLGLLGRLYEIPETLLFIREHAQRSIRAKRSGHARAAWFDPAKEGRLTFPAWRVWWGYLESIRVAPLPLSERARCYGHMIRWVRLNRRLMRNDMVYNARKVLRRGARPKPKEVAS